MHPTFSGNYLIAKNLFETLVGLFPSSMRQQSESGAAPLTETECAEQLAFTDWGRMMTLTPLERQFTQPPFCDQLDAQVRDERIRHELARLRERLASGGLDQAIATYRRALERQQDDFMLRMDFAFLLMSHGDFDEATLHILVLQNSLPHHPAPHVLHAKLMALRQRPEEAPSANAPERLAAASARFGSNCLIYRSSSEKKSAG